MKAYNYNGDYMSFAYLFLIGILIGTAMVIPGVSGAVIAVIFGVYDKMIFSLVNLFKDFKKHFLFLFILGLGILIGALWFSNVMIFLYKNHEVITKLSFIGLILGGVPYLFKDVKLKNEKINYLVIILTILVSIVLWFLSKNSINFLNKSNSNSSIINFILLFGAGIIYSIGKVVPGISGSFLLIIIGLYEYVLSVMSHPITFGLRQIDKLIPFSLGLVFGVLCMLKLMRLLLEKKFGLIYSMIIGFVIGSIVALIPSSFSIIGIIFMSLAFILSYKLAK